VLLGKDEPLPVNAVNEGASGSPFVLIGDHAGRRVPASLGDLGLPHEELARHIGWDIGVAELGGALAFLLDSPFISQVYSRLVIDCNRDPGRADSIVEVGDGTSVPGNAGLNAVARAERVAEIFTPYHAAIGRALDAREGMPTAVVAVHSFTPVFGGYTRPWRFGVLHRGDSPLSAAMLSVLREAEGEAVVGDNEPYAMDTVDYSIPHHCDARGLDYLELEVRQDLIAKPEDAEAMAEYLAPMFVAALHRLAG
jgi:predicted N-formylglutamate amidohydrolase